jgi:transcriptional regulator with PAS, ATPase and Fis domain
MTAAAQETLAGVVAASAQMRDVLELVARLAEPRSPVLITGESGTGKDLIAHLLHYTGPRRDGPFIRIHCPSIPEDLLESELFGHEKGAFTDAQRTKLGKLELAAGGSVYFDQIHDLQPRLQAKLLRVIEERRFERVGGTRTLEIDARFVASSSVDLRAAVAAGTFREDLYHRIGVLPIALPPLRERRADIPPLAELFLARERERHPTAARGFSEDAREALAAYGWPGNVRELRAAVERAVLAAKANELVGRSALPESVLEPPETLWQGRARQPTLKDVEQAYLRHVLAQAKGNQTRAAAILGISRKALWEKRRRYGIP